MAESDPELEARADAEPPDAESIGPDSVADIPLEVEPIDSEAPADVAATHGPDAVAIAEAEGEVDLDVAHPGHAEPHQVPAGIPIEPSHESEEQPPAA